MALIKCTECDNEVSDKASACPKCGAPIEKVQEQKSVEAEKKSRPQNTTAQTNDKKISTWKILIPVVIVILGAFAFLTLQNNSNTIPGIKLEINPPNPQLITSRADEVNSTLLKRKVTVYATVQNQGGEGNVLITFTVSQAGKDYTRSQSVFMRSQESIDIEETFTEVKMLDGQITFDVNVKGQ
jgi:uncharacterized membrane protein YvbJ